MKIYIFMRKDLKMRRGKEIAQACHAIEKLGAPSGLPKIVLRVNSESELLEVCRDGVVVEDAGCTEVKPGTRTCGALIAESCDFGELY